MPIPDMVSFAAFVVYDYLLTSGREIRYIWRRGFSGPAILFYVMRYSALANAIFVVIDLKPWATMTDHVSSRSGAHIW